MKIKRNIVRKRDFGYILIAIIVFFSCFKNSYLNNIFSHLSTGQFYLRSVICALCLVIILVYKRRLSWLSARYAILLAIFIFSAVIHSSHMKSALSVFSEAATICLLLEVLYDQQHDLETVLRVWEVAMLLAVAIDIATEVLYPDGLYLNQLNWKCWFLGYKTERIRESFALIIIEIYLTKKYKGRLTKRSALIFLAVILESALSSGMAITAMFTALAAVLFVYEYLSKKRPLQAARFFGTLMNYKVILLIYVLITIVVVFTEDSRAVRYISELFGKRSGISNRDMIWMRMINQIAHSPILGIGFRTTTQYFDINGIEGATNAHNEILTVLINGGAAGLAIYILIFAKTLRRYENTVIAYMAITVYAGLLLGVVSSIYVTSAYKFLPLYLITAERSQMKGLSVWHGK